MRYKPDWKRRKEVTVLWKGERLPGEDRQKKHMEKPRVTVLWKGELLPGEDRQKKHMEKPRDAAAVPLGTAKRGSDVSGFPDTSQVVSSCAVIVAARSQ
ncbi:hypothetical protein NDU88_001393 [Pleurodeles waltl]|uniref:Uncharacterized protein n=1 Tax=Pleurodeles waltl TaxID=8319 RepID=A0AAV7SCI0_PLEWA|nr:hypothetical protein NDU88_001393 [Pleurodeles waltl]